MSGAVGSVSRDLLDGWMLGEAPRFTERTAFGKGAPGDFFQRGFHFALEDGALNSGVIAGGLR
jgi:hypothetical protein